MADVTISYKNNEIATMNATGVKTLLTGDTFCEDDIVVAYTKPATPAPTLQAKTNISPTTSSQTITADNGYDGLSSVQINAMPSGSAATPATTITVNPSISVSSGGLITASNSKTQSVTPTVSAGYVSSGTAGTITVSGSNTSQLTTQAAQTLYPSTTDQTIASGKYLTGTQTFKGVLLTNLDAGNIKKDVVVKVGDSADDDRIISVTGTYEGSGGGGPNLPDPSTVTDLANTTWLLNENIDTTTFPFTSSAKAKVIVQTGAPSYETPGKQTYYTGYEIVYAPNFIFNNPYAYSGATTSIQCYMSAFNIARNAWGGLDTIGIIYNNTVTPLSTSFMFAGTGNSQPGLRVWTFWGDCPNGTTWPSTDNTNANLIAWMQANATLINIG